jgi:hypothetical protein
VIFGSMLTEESSLMGILLKSHRMVWHYWRSLLCPGSRYPPAKPEALLLLAPQWGLIATGQRQEPQPRATADRTVAHHRKDGETHCRTSQTSAASPAAPGISARIRFLTVCNSSCYSQTSFGRPSCTTSSRSELEHDSSADSRPAMLAVARPD